MLDKAIIAVTATDKAVTLVYEACQKNGYALFVTADHGNAEVRTRYGTFPTPFPAFRVVLRADPPRPPSLFPSDSCVAVGHAHA